jgi:hypothetical protein
MDYEAIIAASNCFIAFSNFIVAIVLVVSFIFHFDPAGHRSHNLD